MRWILRWLEGWRLAALLMAGAGLASVLLGPDRTWDARNYHLYTPWALLAGRPEDVLAAGIQGFHNPTLDLPYALLLLALNAWPRLLCFLMGLPTGLALWLVWRLARTVFAAEPQGAALAWLAMLGAAGGSVLRSQVGSVAGDTHAGVLVLAALVAAVPARTWPRAALAGLACGAAIGLKLTNAPYAVALAAMLALAPGMDWRGRAGLLAACAAGGAAGVLLGGGWWGLRLWHGFGNPLFPYFQDLLVPGWEGTRIGRDARFLADGAWDALTRPFRWAVSGTPLATEERMRDPRIAAGLVAALLLPVLAWRGRVAPGLLPLAAFFLVALALWSALFGIYRYAFPLEAIAPLLVLGALAPLRRAVPAGLALAAAAAVATIPNPSGRAVPAPRYLDIAWPALAPGAVVLQTESPVSFTAFGLPPGVPMASANGVEELGMPRFRDRMAALLAGERPLYLVSPAAGQGWERLARWELEPVAETCRRTCTNWSAQGVGPMVCALRRAGGEAAPTPRWPAPSRLCEAAGPGLESAGRRGLGLAPGAEALLDLGPGCALARIRRADGAAAAIVAHPPGEAEGAMLTLAPPPDGIVRLTAAGPVVIAEAGCIAWPPSPGAQAALTAKGGGGAAALPPPMLSGATIRRGAAPRRAPRPAPGAGSRPPGAAPRAARHRSARRPAAPPHPTARHPRPLAAAVRPPRPVPRPAR